MSAAQLQAARLTRAAQLAQDRIHDMRSRALTDRRSAFYGAGAMKLELVEARTYPDGRPCKTMGTDGTHLYYNPDYTATLSDAVLVSAVCHESGHCLYQHPWRGKGKDRADWNRAIDTIVNNELAANNLPLGDGWVTDPTIGDLSAEALYAKIVAERPAPEPQAPPPAPQDAQPEPEEDPDEPAGDDDDEPQTDESEDPDAESDVDPDDTEPDADDGEPEPAEPEEDPDAEPEDLPAITTGPGEILEPLDPDAPDADSAEVPVQTAEDWGVFAVQAARMAAKTAGADGAGLLRRIEQERRVEADWRVELDRFLEPTAPSDYSSSRPNKHYLYIPLFVPGVVMADMPGIDVWIDTSCSVTDSMLAAMAGHLNLIMSQRRPAYIRVVYCDAAIQGEQTFYPDGEPVVLIPMGGGGTAFGPLFAYAEQQPEPPTVAVILTDLEGSDNHTLTEPDYPVLWVTPLWCQIEAPFGRTVRMDLGGSRW